MICNNIFFAFLNHAKSSLECIFSWFVYYSLKIFVFLDHICLFFYASVYLRSWYFSKGSCFVYSNSYLGAIVESIYMFFFTSKMLIWLRKFQYAWKISFTNYCMSKMYLTYQKPLNKETKVFFIQYFIFILFCRVSYDRWAVR